MNITTITKEFMYEELKKLLNSLFDLPEVILIVVKGTVIKSLDDELSIIKALNESFHDIYSDIDVNIEIKLCKEEYNGSSFIYADCLRRLGLENDILGLSHYCTEERGEVIRLCKTNGMRFDLIITAVCMKDATLLPHDDLSENLRKANDFWFIAIQALGKLMRKDYLIASHLSHLLIQKGLELQMIMRDNEKGTNFHRYGYEDELFYLNTYSKEEISFAETSDDSYNHIARLLYSAVKSYDNLSYMLDNSYKSRINDYLEIWSCYLENA